MILCGPPKGCTCPGFAWTCVCREGNVKRGCLRFKPLLPDPRGHVRCRNCGWQDWQHPEATS